MFLFGHSNLPTEQEQIECVKSLRQRLSDGSQPVEEQLSKGGEVGLQGLDDVSLRRWLTAEDFQTKKAEKRLRSHAKWRAKEFPNGAISESEIKEELASKKVFLQGLDKEGRRIILLKAKRHLRSVRDLQQCMRLLCYSLDKAIAHADKERNPGGMICGIFDLTGLSMENIDYHALKGVLDMLQTHYPERLGRLWMYEAPSIFWALWKAVSPFIDPKTKKKITFVSGASAIEQLEAEIDREVLPKDLSGGGEMVLIQDFAGQNSHGNAALPETNGKSAAESVSSSTKEALPAGIASNTPAKPAYQEVAENGILVFKLSLGPVTRSSVIEANGNATSKLPAS